MVATRSNTSEAFEDTVFLAAVSSSKGDCTPDISSDGLELYFCEFPKASGLAGVDLLRVSINPVVDLNGDGIVDAADMCIVVDHWGEDYPLCDIGPMPWGDGVVDVHDLIVLAEHLFEEFPSAEVVPAE